MDEVEGHQRVELSGNGRPANTHDSEDLTSLREEYRNAKERMERQKETFHEFAEEGRRMLRITLIFLGLLVTAVSALGSGVTELAITPSQCAIGTSSNCLTISDLTIAGGLGLVVSALGHLRGTEARAVKSQGSVEDIDSVVQCDVPTERSFFKTRLQTYRDHIDYNHRIISVMEDTLAIAKLGLGFSILILAGIGLVISIGPLSLRRTLAILLVILLVLVLTIRSWPDEYIAQETPWALQPIIRRVILTGDGTLDEEEDDPRNDGDGTPEGDADQEDDTDDS